MRKVSRQLYSILILMHSDGSALHLVTGRGSAGDRPISIVSSRIRVPSSLVRTQTFQYLGSYVYIFILTRTFRPYYLRPTKGPGCLDLLSLLTLYNEGTVGNVKKPGGPEAHLCVRVSGTSVRLVVRRLHPGTN